MPADHVLTRAEARERAALVGDMRYDVALDLTRGEDTFASTTTVTFAASAGASTFVDLVAERVRRAELNGSPLPAEAIGDGRINLEGVAERNELVVESDCSFERTGVGLHRFTDPVDGATYLHTQFEPFDAHRMYACFDQPDLKAPFGLRVTAPSEWEVIANNAATERVDDGGVSHWTFAPTLPISTYLTALVAGPFKSVHTDHGDVRLGWWTRASLLEHLEAEADELFELTKQGFDYFEDVFDVAYPFGQGLEGGRPSKKYDQLLVPEFNFGAMENPGCVTFNEAYVFRSKVTDAARQSRGSTILHELAHMWFGNLVTMRWWDDLWLNESFATYMGHRALVDATRFTDAWAAFASQLKAWAIDADQLPSTHPITADLVDTDALRTHFDGITYAKGASVLKQLVAWVGDEPFFAGLRDYFDRHAYANAELADFLGALERSSGRDLASWSREWLETSGVGTLEPVVTRDGDRVSQVAVRQRPAEIGDPTLRRHRLSIGAYRDARGALRRSEHATLDVDGELTDVDELSPLEPAPAVLLPNDDDAAFAKLRLDEASIHSLRTRLGDLDGAVAAAVAWGALWDMVRDAELAASTYVELSAAHADRLDDLTALQLVQGRAVGAADRYGQPANREANHAGLLKAGREAMMRAEPGSGRQLAWVKHLLRVGGSDLDHRAWMLGLLQGEASEPGLEVDTDLRWQLVVRLAADGAVGEDAIAAEMERDPTDMGLRHAATARAARPGAGSKAHAWDEMLGNRELSLAMLRAMASGFWRFGQEDALAQFAERYPEAVEAAWDDRVQEESIALSRGLFPSTVIDQRTVEIADSVLEDPELPTPARRVVSEERDHVVRALRAREADRTG